MRFFEIVIANGKEILFIKREDPKIILIFFESHLGSTNL